MSCDLKFSAESQKIRGSSFKPWEKGKAVLRAHRFSLLYTFASIDLDGLTHRGWKEKPEAAIGAKQDGKKQIEKNEGTMCNGKYCVDELWLPVYD